MSLSKFEGDFIHLFIRLHSSAPRGARNRGARPRRGPRRTRRCAPCRSSDLGRDARSSAFFSSPVGAWGRQKRGIMFFLVIELVLFHCSCFSTASGTLFSVYLFLSDRSKLSPPLSIPARPILPPPPHPLFFFPRRGFLRTVGCRLFGYSRAEPHTVFVFAQNCESNSKC